MMFTVLFIILFAVAAHAAVDCMKKPDLSIKAASNCCSMKDARRDAYPVKCSKFFINSNIPISACAHECVLNETKILQNGKFQLSNIRPFVTKLFTENIALQSFLLAYEKCAIRFNKNIENGMSYPYRRQSSKLQSMQHCSPLSMKYGVCTYTEVFVNCPAMYWIESSTCKLIKDYLKNCDSSASSGRNTTRNQFVRV